MGVELRWVDNFYSIEVLQLRAKLKTTLVIGICDPIKSRARHHRSYLLLFEFLIKFIISIR